LRKFVFGRVAAYRPILDFGLLHDDASMADYVLDVIDHMDFCGVRVRLTRRKGANAQLEIRTPLGEVGQPAAISVRDTCHGCRSFGSRRGPFDALDRAWLT